MGPPEPEALQTGAGPPEPGDSSDWGHQNQRTATNKRISQNEHNHQLGCLGTGNHDNKRISQNKHNHQLGCLGTGNHDNKRTSQNEQVFYEPTGKKDNLELSYNNPETGD